MFARSVDQYKASDAVAQRYAGHGSTGSTSGRTPFSPQSAPSSPPTNNILRPTSPAALNVPFSGPRNGSAKSITAATKPYNSVSGGKTGLVQTERRPETTPKSKVPANNGGTIGKLHEAVYFDEGDFDDDIDLDVEIEHPGAKDTIVATRHVPTIAKIQSSPSATHNPGPTLPSSSGVPLTWPSSPLDHRQDAAARPGANTAAGDNGQDDHIPPKKRRALPWVEREKIQQAREKNLQATQSSASWPSSRSTDITSTPVPKQAVDTNFLWDKTASAVKADHLALKQSRAKKSQVKEEEEVVEEPRKPIATGAVQDVSPIFLSDEQRRVMEMVLKQKKSIFFTGSAGTGKSVLLREIIREARAMCSREPDRVAVTASTGLAACNIGGITLHSFGGIGLGKDPVATLERKIKRNPKAKTRWLRTKMLVIDEVSMVDGDLFDKLDQLGRKLRNNGLPFGGMQLVLTGDFFQLPPVPDSGRVARFAFDANSWSSSVDHTIRLTQVFRQSDPVFAGMLNDMRLGKMTQQSINTFHSLSRPIHYDDGLDATELFPTRIEVENANAARMRQLPGQSVIFDSVDGGKIQEKDQRDKLLSNCLAPPSITLKKNAQVMLIKNTDGSLVNGSLGKVVDFMTEKQCYLADPSDESSGYASNGITIGSTLSNTNSRQRSGGSPDIDAPDTSKKWPLVRFTLPNGTTRDLLVQPERWTIELPNGEVQASRSQLPIILAWALSIHKAQGQTLARVKVDLGKVFEKGQAYVALSRATTQEGLQVLRFDPKKVLAHHRVMEFYGGLKSADEVSKKRKRIAKPKPEPEGAIDLEDIDSFAKPAQPGRMTSYWD